MLKIGFSAKFSLSRISKQKHAPISEWHSTITSCLLISLLSRTMFNSLLWLDFLRNWSCCSHNLIASKKTDLNQENSPFSSPFRSLLSARCRPTVSCGCDFGPQVVFCACVPCMQKVPTSTTGQPYGFKRLEKGILRNPRKKSDCQAFSFLNPF